MQMNILFILAHPEPNSFNGSLVKLGCEQFQNMGHHTDIVDLYDIGFDPVEKAGHYSNRQNTDAFSPLGEQRHAYNTETLAPEIYEQISKLETADIVICQFPIWWHSVPAILKGWMDRVFISSGLYSSKMRYDKGYFKGKMALCSFTTGAPPEAFIAGGRGGEIDQILWSTQFSLSYMGFDVMAPHGSFGVAGHGYSYADEDVFQKQFETLENNWRNRLIGLNDETPLAYPGWDDWDALGQPIVKSK